MGHSLRLDDLRAMKHLLSNTRMQHVYIVCPKRRCGLPQPGSRCHAHVLFTEGLSEEPALEVNVDAELRKAKKRPKKRSPSRKTPRRDLGKTCCDTPWSLG